MKFNVQNPRCRALALAAVSFCGSNSANPQATGSQAGMQAAATHAGVANAAPQAEIRILRQELSVLEGRVHELEVKAGDAKSPDDDAPTKKIEQSEIRPARSSPKGVPNQMAWVSSGRDPSAVYRPAQSDPINT